MKYDVFIGHAYEDKDSVARPLAEILREVGLRVWYDEFNLELGDSLTESIDLAIAQSRFGVIIVSKSFLGKSWPRRELRGLLSRELDSGHKIVLPVWHNISKSEILAASPPLVDVVAVTTRNGIENVASQIVRVVMPGWDTEPSWSKTKSLSLTKPDQPLPTQERSIDGEYSVSGSSGEGRSYYGRATIRSNEGRVIISSLIAGQTHICYGSVRGADLRVYGDFDVKYQLQPDGSITGIWGDCGREALTPLYHVIPKPAGFGVE